MGSRDDVTITAAALRECAEGLVKMAQRSKPGAWGEAVLEMFPPSVFSVDFDGQGGILVNPSSLQTPNGRALFRALKAAGQGRVQVGTWSGSGGAA
jgi:hypothetical protein